MTTNAAKTRKQNQNTYEKTGVTCHASCLSADESNLVFLSTPYYVDISHFDGKDDNYCLGKLSRTHKISLLRYDAWGRHLRVAHVL